MVIEDVCSTENYEDVETSSTTVSDFIGRGGTNILLDDESEVYGETTVDTRLCKRLRT